ncbi:MAG: GFA family protein [Pseudomonas marincola]
MPEEKQKTAGGGCLCGDIRFEVTGKLNPVTYCHCKQCRIWHGDVIGYSGCDRGDLNFLSNGTLQWFHSSTNGRRGFCTSCGSSLFWADETEDYIAITAGCFDEPTGLTATSHIFVGSAGDYYEIHDKLPRHNESSS